MTDFSNDPVHLPGHKGVLEAYMSTLNEDPFSLLIQAHKDDCTQARLLMEGKNHDYASKDDPFRNFRQFGRLGIFVRLSDKLARLRNFAEGKELKTLDETVRDTVLDIINYAVLFLEYTD